MNRITDAQPPEEEKGAYTMLSHCLRNFCHMP